MSKSGKWVEAGLVSVWAIFTPVHSVLIGSGTLVFIDLFTGVAAARKRQERITSAKLRHTLSKLFIYESALCLAFVAEHYISDILPFVKMCSAMISVVELKSCYENLNTISETDLLKALISKIGSSNQ